MNAKSIKLGIVLNMFYGLGKCLIVVLLLNGACLHIQAAESIARTINIDAPNVNGVSTAVVDIAGVSYDEDNEIPIRFYINNSASDSNVDDVFIFANPNMINSGSLPRVIRLHIIDSSKANETPINFSGDLIVVDSKLPVIVELIFDSDAIISKMGSDNITTLKVKSHNIEFIGEVQVNKGNLEIESENTVSFGSMISAETVTVHTGSIDLKSNIKQ